MAGFGYFFYASSNPVRYITAGLVVALWVCTATAAEQTTATGGKPTKTPKNKKDA